MTIKIPTPKTTFYPLKGGLNQMSPAITLPPGMVFDAQNYLPEISGGYRRRYGFERADGRPSPTLGNYWFMKITLTGSIAVGNTVTGGTSAATGKVLGLYSGVLVLGRITGTFVANEALRVAGVTQATSLTNAAINGASMPSDDADYALLTANDLRADIQKIPGSGAPRGVVIFNDIVYGFRDNAGGTAGDLYKQTTGGWVQVTFGKEVQFTGATGQITDGQTVTGATSGASGVVTRAMLRTGTWTVSGVGTLIFASITGTFSSGENLQVASVTKAVSSTVSTAIVRATGGKIESVNANFTGSASTKKVYGADGVNFAFEFDGTTYIPIRTGMTTDTPLHVMEHRNSLYLTFLGSLQNSSSGLPYAWTVVTGANEFATGEQITGLLPQAGNYYGPAMAIFTKNRTFIQYGIPGGTGYQLVPSIYDTGYADYTMQPVGNTPWGLSARGIQSLLTTLSYGDFEYEAISFNIQTLLNSKRGLSCASSVNKSNNDYRLYFTDGTGIVIGLTGDKPNGILPLNYGIPVRIITSTTLSTGEEVTYFTSDDGYVYKDNTGTSFDGSTIESWIRPVFNNLQSPQDRKSYKRATFEVKTDGYAQVQVSFDIGYANPDVGTDAFKALTLIGAGGYWDQVTWDQFTWDTKIVSNQSLSLDGTETNIGFLFYSNRAQDKSHVVQGISLTYIPRRLQRGS
jgi:hypothetical protein